LDKLKAYKIESGEKIQFAPTDIDEFRDLNQAIASLTARNQQAYFAQKEFTENASHEMQSPLAVIQGKTDLLMQTSPLTEEQAELISDLNVAAQRMNRLNRSLLLLSKIENRQFHEQDPVDMTDMLSRTLRQYGDALEQKHILTTLNLSPQPVILTGNRSLLETLTGNLVANAIRHNREEGSLIIDLNAVSLQIRNSGKSAALETSKLFRRFQKQTADPNSTGLGLEIIKKICDLYRFKIEYRFENELHHFIIRFHP
jgi:signal transduction histidine kinase